MWIAVEVMMDLALESNFNQLFHAVRYGDGTEELRRRRSVALRHPRTVMTFSDSGAHVSLIMDSSIHTHLLAYWMRERSAFSLEEAVKMITLTPAVAWGFADRGLLRSGLHRGPQRIRSRDDCAADADDRERPSHRSAKTQAEVGRHRGDSHCRQSCVQERRAHRLAGGKLLRSTAAGVR